MAMKQMSIQDLTARLSAAIAEAESGETLVITRHNAPVAHLGPPADHGLHRARAVGSGRLRPAIKGGTGGRYLTLLAEDRGNR